MLRGGMQLFSFLFGITAPVFPLKLALSRPRHPQSSVHSFGSDFRHLDFPPLGKEPHDDDIYFLYNCPIHSIRPLNKELDVFRLLCIALFYPVIGMGVPSSSLSPDEFPSSQTILPMYCL